MSYPGIRVLLVDDHQVVRQGLRMLIEADGLTVVGETGTGTHALELCVHTCPDVVLLDPVLPDLSGAEVLRAILGLDPQIRVIILTDAVDLPLMQDLVAAGACRYLLKRVDRQALLSAIRNPVQGRYDITTAGFLTAAEPRRACLETEFPRPGNGHLSGDRSLSLESFGSEQSVWPGGTVTPAGA